MSTTTRIEEQPDRAGSNRRGMLRSTAGAALIGMSALSKNLRAQEPSSAERTVKNVIYGVTHRLKLRNRSHAVAYALRAGMI